MTQMNVHEQIDQYINGLPQQKRNDMKALHLLISNILPNDKRWFDEGKNSESKVVSNPSVGYGTYVMTYANGTTREYYKIGISANTAGLSVYILGIEDKTYLANTYGKTLGKASLSGYCIKFKQLNDINIDILEAAIRDNIC